MCEHNYWLCFNSHIQRTCTKKLFRNIFHVFTSALTHFRLGTKNKIELFAAFRLWTIVTYVTLNFLYIFVKMLILENLQISCTAFSKILNARYLYRDFGTKETIYFRWKKSCFYRPTNIFSENDSWAYLIILRGWRLTLSWRRPLSYTN